MSTQRRRVLASTEAGIPIDKISDGVYIEGLDGKAYKADDWQGGNDANSVVVASGDIKFRIALTQPLSQMSISSSYNDPLDNYMTGTTSSATALSDYDGAGNTANIMKVQPSTDYAAGYCNAFIFPDGKTKGFLPSVGQLNLAYQNKAAVNAALSKCDGTAMRTKSYWSSTFWGVDGGDRVCWRLRWNGGYVEYGYLGTTYYVRPFADIFNTFI